MTDIPWDPAALALIAQDMRSRGMAEQVAGDELLKLANRALLAPPLAPVVLTVDNARGALLQQLRPRVELPEDPPVQFASWLRDDPDVYISDAARFARALICSVWDAARREVERQQGATLPAEALAARPLLEQVARMGDCISANTVGDIMAISDRAKAWLEENPPGQSVAIWRRISELEEWKASAMAVEREWDANAIATMLGGTLGESQRAVVQREVPRLLARVRELETFTSKPSREDLRPAPPDDGEPTS